MNTLRKILPGIAVLFLITQNAAAQQAASVTDTFTWQVRVQQENSANDEDQHFLEWSNSIYLVQNAGSKKFVPLKGKFAQPVKTALLNGKPIEVGSDGSFSLKIVVTDEKKIRFNIFVTFQNEKTEHKMQYSLTPLNPGAHEMAQLQSPWWRFSGGLGATLISFRQRNVPAFEEWALTVKAGLNYSLVPNKWDLGVSSFFNAVVLSNNSAAGYEIQYFGFNGKASYHLLDTGEWKINLSGGLYLNSSIGNVGFANMIGPQFSPEIVYTFSNGNTLFWYGKFAFTLDGGVGTFFKDNREAAMGLHYSFPISTTNRLSLGVDMSQLSLANATNWASTNTYSFSGGLSF